MTVNNWQAAWRVARFDIWTSKSGFIITGILFAYVAIIGMPLFDEIYSGEIGRAASWAPEFMYITILPNMGFLMNRAVLHYWRDDPYSRKLAVWRTIPISLSSIALGRLMQLVLVAIPVWLLFFGLQYGVSPSIQAAFDGVSYLNYALFWLAYSVTVGTGIAYCEMGYSGRSYFIICCFMILFYAPITFVTWLTGETSIERMTSAATAGNWLPTLIAWVIAILVLIVGRTAIERRLRQRSLLG